MLVLTMLDSDVREAVLLRQSASRSSTVPKFVGETLCASGTACLAAHRLVRRLTHDRRFVPTGVECVTERNAHDAGCLLSLPAEVVTAVVALLETDPATLQALLATSVDMHATVVAHLRERLDSTGALPWRPRDERITTATCTAIELALAAMHFVSRSQMHAFSPCPSYAAVRAAIVKQHARFGMRVGVRVETVDETDAGGGVNVAPWYVFSRIEEWPQPHWLTRPLSNPHVRIVCAGRLLALMVGDDVLLCVQMPESGRSVVVTWLLDDSIAVCCNRHPNHRFVFSCVNG